MKKLMALFISGGVILFALSYIGVAKDTFYEESYNVIFIKKYPTFKMVFINPTLSDSDVPPIENWSNANDRWNESAKNELFSYCKYRFGILDSSTKVLAECAKKTFLSPHIILNWG